MTTTREEKTELVFAADLGGTHLRAAAIDKCGRLDGRIKKRTPQASRAQEIVSALVSTARDCQEKTTDQGMIKAVSVAVPGTVDVAEGVVVKAPNLPCLDGFNLAAALRSELDLPAVIENDANAAAVGEMWLGAARGVDTLICITLGTGVGGGIILDGKLWRGVDNSAAEIGHMGVDPFGGVKCPCGSSGCLEVYASATAIVRMARESRASYPASVLQSRDDLTAEEIFRAGVSGDELALDVFRRMGVYLGIGLATLVNLLNPSMFVIAGGVANGWDLFAKHALAQVKERAFPIPAARVQIKRGECGDDAGLLGVARLGFTAPEH